MAEQDRANKDRKEKMLKFKSRLFPGVTAFILILVFFNLVRQNKMTWLDWAIIFAGVLIFFYTLFASIKHKKNTRADKSDPDSSEGGK